MKRKRRRSAQRRKSPPRDMDASPFARILGELIERVPGAYAAALVDQDGETVDYAGRVDPFDVKVAAAHFRIVLDEVSRPALGKPRSLVVRASRGSFLAIALPEEYAVVLLLRRRAGFSSASRGVEACMQALHTEAKWPEPMAAGGWSFAEVWKDGRGRPTRVRLREELPQRVEILGAMVGLRRGERGYRVRLDSGSELTLVREPSGFWYADETAGLPMSRSR